MELIFFGRVIIILAAIVGLIPLLICVNRRTREIGGWLLYYYIQLYVAVVFILISTVLTVHDYLPPAWAAQPGLYPWFLLSIVPGRLVLLVQLVFAEMLRLSRDYRHVHALRLVLWADFAAAIIAIAIDVSFFKHKLILDILALIWPFIWLPYFYVSKRVVRVFRTNAPASA